jgi:hypothetical protein
VAGSRNATARRFTDAQYAKGVTLTDALILSGDMPLPTKAQMPDWNVPCPCRCHTSTSSAAASPAKTSQSPGEAKGSTGHARVFGASTPDSFANYDPGTSSWRTSQLSLLEEWSVFSGTWPRAGMTRSGIAYRLRPLAPLTGGIASGLWRTPRAAEAEHSGRQAPPKPGQTVGLTEQVAAAEQRMWPTPHGICQPGPRRPGPPGNELGRAVNEAETWGTPTARDWKDTGDMTNVPENGLLGRQVLNRQEWRTPQARDGDQRGPSDPQKRVEQGHSVSLHDQVGGSLNPTWVEWLMGFPLGWTDCGA